MSLSHSPPAPFFRGALNALPLALIGWGAILWAVAHA